MRTRPPAEPEAPTRPAIDLSAVAIINLVAALSGAGFAFDGEASGALVLCGLIAGYNLSLLLRRG